jgi:CheY-like chemotaxis protein
VAADSGTGLGLVISQHIVHLMGCPSGISVRSPWKWQQEASGAAIANEKVGAGSRFSFSVVPKNLTFNTDAEKAGASGPSPTSSTRSPTLVSPIRKHVKATIMVVDDELLNRMVLLSKLRQCEERVRGQLGADRSGLEGEPDACRFSMEVVQAEHAEMALVMMHDKIEARQKQGATDVVHVDIVILDEHMESSGGILKGTEAVTHIRQLAQKHGEKQPVVVLSSGNCSQADRQRYTAMGADATWPKPYPTGDLVVESLVEWVLVDRKPSVF